MLTRQISFAVFFFLHIASANDCSLRNAIEFWRDVICLTKNSKIVKFHGVLDNGDDRAALSVSRCFDAFVHDVARKCQTTIVSQTYTAQHSRNKSVGAVISNDITWPKMLAPDVAFGSSPMDNTIVSGQSAWNIQVIFTKDIRFFHHISKDSSSFEWNPRDRFIVLIASRRKHKRPNKFNLQIDEILKSLWYERKIQNIFVCQEILVTDKKITNRVARTYNPFAKVNESAWGKIEIMKASTASRVSYVLSNLTYRRTKDLNGYKLKVGVFEQGQSISKTSLESSVTSRNTLYEYSEVYRGFDEITLDTVARYMNFQANRIHPRDNISFGHQLSNGTYVGAIGDVVHGRTDVCFVSFFIKRYGSNAGDVEFTTYVEFDRVCVIVPKAPKIPKWLRIYHFFPPSVWICSMLAHVLTYLTWYFLQTFSPQRTKRIHFLDTVYRSFLLNAGCPQRLPSANAERILLAGVFLASVTMVGIFNGILYNSFARDMYYEDMDRLKDLDASGLPISFASFSVSDLFGPKNDADAAPLMRNLRKKLRHGYNALKNTAYHRNVSGLIREHHFPIISEQLVDADGAHLLHLVKECPGRYYLSYLLPRHSILRERINVLIGRLNQAGLPVLWNRRTVQGFVSYKKLLAKRKQALKEGESQTDGFVPFKLCDMQTSFYMLLIGHSLSTIVFCHEKGWLKIPFLRTVRENASSKSKRTICCGRFDPPEKERIKFSATAGVPGNSQWKSLKAIQI